MLKNLLLLSIFSAFVTVTLTASNIYLSQKKTTVPESIQGILAPISSTFDNKTIDMLRKRTSIPVNLTDKSNAENSSEKTEPSPSTTSAGLSVTVTPTKTLLP